MRILYGGPHAGERRELIGREGERPPIWIVWVRDGVIHSSYFRLSMDEPAKTFGPMFR